MENHFIQLENKKNLTVTDVVSVEAFDEETILVNLQTEGLILCGKDLHIEVLDLEEGRLSASGEFESITYSVRKAGTGILYRLKKRFTR